MHVDDTFVAATTTDFLDEFETVAKSQIKSNIKSNLGLLGLLEEYKDELAKSTADPSEYLRQKGALIYIISS